MLLLLLLLLLLQDLEVERAGAGREVVGMGPQHRRGPQHHERLLQAARRMKVRLKVRVRVLELLRPQSRALQLLRRGLSRE